MRNLLYLLWGIAFVFCSCRNEPNQIPVKIACHQDLSSKIDDLNVSYVSTYIDPNVSSAWDIEKLYKDIGIQSEAPKLQIVKADFYGAIGGTYEGWQTLESNLNEIAFMAFCETVLYLMAGGPFGWGVLADAVENTIDACAMYVAWSSVYRAFSASKSMYENLQASGTCIYQVPYEDYNHLYNGITTLSWYEILSMYINMKINKEDIEDDYFALIGVLHNVSLFRYFCLENEDICYIDYDKDPFYSNVGIVETKNDISTLLLCDESEDETYLYEVKLLDKIEKTFTILPKEYRSDYYLDLSKLLSEQWRVGNDKSAFSVGCAASVMYYSSRFWEDLVWE